MKKLLVFTALLLSSFCEILACGYSPFGEDVRYCLYRPDYFNINQFYSFNYTSNLWSYNYFPDSQYESNVIDWYNYTNKKVPIESVNDFLNNLKFSDINSQSSNEFIFYLFKKKDFSAIKYLTIAKKCEESNAQYVEDQWERKEDMYLPYNKKMLNEILQSVAVEKDNDIKRKYIFQAIRVSFYNNDYNSIKALFENHLKASKKDYIYYWSLYFYCFTNPQKNAVNIATTFANCPEKSYPIYYYFHKDFNVKQALQQAKTDQEIAAVYAFNSVQKVDQNLQNLKKNYRHKPHFELLDFLLLREINKIEDWVYTPYFTNYLPSIIHNSNLWNENAIKVTTQTLRLRSENDRLYAKELLSFINSVDIAKVKNKDLWLSARIQLQYIVREYESCLTSIASFEIQFKSEKIAEQVQKIKALCLTAKQVYGRAIIEPAIQSIILKYKNDDRFIFALGRELEFKGNISNAMALISFLEVNKKNNDFEVYDGNDTVEWRGNRLKNSGNLPYFYSYFEYLDFVYDAKNLQSIINTLKSPKEKGFYSTIYSKLNSDKNYLIDLLGTKYLREEKLTQSLRTFQTLNQHYWDENYNGWERDLYDEYYSFDKNPFYSLKNTNDFITPEEKYFVNKKTVMEHLVKYLNLVNDPKNANKDYYYFLIANCYYNMSQNGNSWMMRRIESTYRKTQDNYNESYFDEMEYRNNTMAVKYYQLAYKNAKTAKFKALCTRMIGFSKSDTKNKFEELEKQFPQYYNDLSGCYNLEEFFNARR